MSGHDDPLQAGPVSQSPLAARWLAERVAERRLDRIRPSMDAAGKRINDARSNVRAVLAIIETSPSLALAGSHDAARKAITAHMAATGYRPAKGEGGHRLVIDYARVILVDVLGPDDLDDLDDLRRDRAEVEYGDPTALEGARVRSAAELAQRVVDAVARHLARSTGR